MAYCFVIARESMWMCYNPDPNTFNGPTTSNAVIVPWGSTVGILKKWYTLRFGLQRKY